MNTLRIAREKEGVFQNLHPSDPLWIIMASYGSATEFMKDDAPSSAEILSAMYDLIDAMFEEDGSVMKFTLMEIEAILKENGFDFINTIGMRENSSQNFIGGKVNGL